MTEEQLTLARQFCEVVGWEVKPVADGGFLVMRPDGAWTGITWLVCGNGMLAVKAEMARRRWDIITLVKDDRCHCEIRGNDKYIEWLSLKPAVVDAPTEPEAVLKAAVAAMKAGAE